MHVEIKFISVAVFVASAFVWCPLTLLLRKAFVRREKKGAQRRLEFALPDRENQYLRSRLATTLNENFLRETQREERLSIAFSQTLKTLKKVLQAPLSPAERIESEALQARIERYEKKTTFSVQEVREINEAFARILKLSGKYAV